jgi:transposase
LVESSSAGAALLNARFISPARPVTGRAGLSSPPGRHALNWSASGWCAASFQANWGTPLEPWLREQLAGWRKVILTSEAQVRALESESVGRVNDPPRPKALGALTLTTLDREVCDWTRFGNRKQIGSYTGCCPGEHSSGGQRRLGSIDRLANGRVRALLVEAVWRFLLWQPHWKGARRLKVKLTAGPALKKKTVVTLARQLAIDLWRWRTGHCTLADLGWIPA